jgi:hypothetical protein
MNTNKSNKNIAQTKKIIRSRTGKSRTVKSRIPSRNNAIKKIYNRDYYGTELLPITNILNYINANFNEFVIDKERKKNEHKHEVEFDDFFVIDDILERKEKKADINIIIKKNPNMSLKKLLASILYLKSFSWFESGKMNISSFKSQIGKDVSRVSLKINNEDYIIEYPPDGGSLNYYKTADDFNIKIMNVLSTFSVIDFDLVNKIGIIMCQNLFNFITETITLMIMKKIQPEMSVVTRPNKSILINLTKNEQSIIINFESLLSITYNGDLDIQYTCGKLKFTLLIDLKKNTYNFSEFILNYDNEGCNPESNNQPSSSNQQSNNNQPESNNENKGMSDAIKYGIPMGIIATGLVGAPFLLGALGGKNKKIKRKRKSKKNKRKSGNKKYFYS